MSGLFPLGAEAIGGDAAEAPSTVSSVPLGQGPIGSSAIGGVIFGNALSAPEITGSLSGALGSVVSSGSTAEAMVSGSLSGTLGSVTAESLGYMGDLDGTLSATLGSIIASESVGSVRVAGSLDVTLDDVLAEKFGFAANTLDPIVSSSTGTVVTRIVDNLFNEVTLLMHADDYTDVISGTAATTGGNNSISTSIKKFGTGSIFVDSGVLSFPDSPKWDFGTAPFTIEFWINPWASTSQRAFIGQMGAAYSRWNIRTQGHYFRLEYDNGTTVFATTSVYKIFTTGVWHHVCVERDASNAVRVYFDGEMVSKTNDFAVNITGSPNPLVIGSWRTAFDYMDSYCRFDEIRITRGRARYATDTTFALQTAPFPDEGPDDLSGSLVGSLGDLTMYATNAYVNFGGLSRDFDALTITSRARLMDHGNLTKTLAGISATGTGSISARRQIGAAALFIGA